MEKKDNGWGKRNMALNGSRETRGEEDIVWSVEGEKWTNRGGQNRLIGRAQEALLLGFAFCCGSGEKQNTKKKDQTPNRKTTFKAFN